MPRMWLVSILMVCCMTSSLRATFLNVNAPEWIRFKRDYNKNYATLAAEQTALSNFNYNTQLVAKHNLYYERGTYTYSLRINQFADLNLVNSVTLPQRFPLASSTSADNSRTPPAVQLAPPAFDPRTDVGLALLVLDQGTVCSSGWAYATASATELKFASQTFNGARTNPSAQQLIDCAVQQNACTTQVPQSGLDYLVVQNQRLQSATVYPNNPFAATPGTCTAPNAPVTGIPVTQYARINDGADYMLQQYVGNSFPVVVEYNPISYQFMLYGEGVFQQPTTGRGSHFMTVVGYGRDTTRSLDYWLVQNSFGVQWGEMGLIRILRTASKPLAKSAIFPSILQ